MLPPLDDESFSFGSLAPLDDGDEDDDELKVPALLPCSDPVLLISPLLLLLLDAAVLDDGLVVGRLSDSPVLELLSPPD